MKYCDGCIKDKTPDERDCYDDAIFDDGEVVYCKNRVFENETKEEQKQEHGLFTRLGNVMDGAVKELGKGTIIEKELNSMVKDARKICEKMKGIYLDTMCPKCFYRLCKPKDAKKHCDNCGWEEE